MIEDCDMYESVDPHCITTEWSCCMWQYKAPPDGKLNFPVTTMKTIFLSFIARLNLKVSYTRLAYETYTKTFRTKNKHL